MAYDLSSKKPRNLGQTRSTKYLGLHAHRFEKRNPRCEDVKTVTQKDIDDDAPPQDSSEEKRVPIFEADDYGEASDSSDSDSGRKPRSSPQGPKLPSTGPPNEGHSDLCNSKGQDPGQGRSQLCRLKRKADQLSDNETAVNMSFQVSRTGRQKRTAGYGKNRAKPRDNNVSIRVEEKEHEKSIRKVKFQDAKDEVSAFVRPPTDGILAELEKRALAAISRPSSPSPEGLLPTNGVLRSKRPIFKAPQLSGETPEALNTQQRTQKNTNSPQKARPSRAHRSSRELKPIPSNSNKWNIGPASDSAVIAGRMLGLKDEVKFKVPSSVSSIPSPTDKSYASGGFSSPATSLNDDVSFTGVKASLFDDDYPDSLSKKDRASENPDIPKCPMCKATVDSLLLEGFTTDRRLTIREQAKFCQAHQRRTADEEWKAKRYPTIDWSCLHMQVKIYSEAIDEIFKGERFSYYRNAYDDFLKREKHKTLQQSLIQGDGIEDFSPGYYGSRGARIMIDNLMSNFASKLRRRSSSDHLISARGVTTYVRAVLVPELATLLVMDDMKINAEEARKVLRESVDLGNVLNEEQDEVIKDPDMDDIS